MQFTTKLALLSSLLISAATADDLKFCHGGAAGVCQGLTLTSKAETCYATVNATVGTIDTIVALTPGIQYTVSTGANCTGNSSAVFGNGTNTLVAPFLNKVVSLSASIPTVWSALGCYTDFAGSRTLAAASLINGTSMTVELCQSFCDSGAFGFAGVEFGGECYCDYSIQYPAVPDNATSCNIPCAGNANETCGGASRINVFSSGKPLPTIPATVTGPNATTWKYDGCYTDNSTAIIRTLPFHLEPTTGSVTPQSCVNTCFAAGQTLAGVEFGTECWCGTAIQNNATVVGDIQCGQACTADPTFFCGDANRLNVWGVPSNVTAA